MAYKALVTINGYDLPAPSTYKGETSTLVDSTRNTQGKMIGSVVREDVGKVSLTWKYLTVEQWATICKCFKENYGGHFIIDVTFFDQTIGEYVTRAMYVSDRKADMFKLDSEGNVTGWTSCSLNLIEV